jgi:hypothetical protein
MGLTVPSPPGVAPPLCDAPGPTADRLHFGLTSCRHVPGTARAWAAKRVAQVKEEPAQRAGDTEQNALPHTLLLYLRKAGLSLAHDQRYRSGTNSLGQRPGVCSMSLCATPSNTPTPPPCEDWKAGLPKGSHPAQLLEPDQGPFTPDWRTPGAPVRTVVPQTQWLDGPGAHTPGCRCGDQSRCGRGRILQ